MTRAFLLVVLALCLGVGCGGGDQKGAPAGGTEATPSVASEPSEDPGDFEKEIVTQSRFGQYGRVWQTLHPSHQAVASRAEFVACQSQTTPFEGKLEIEVVETSDEPFRIPGQTSDVPSKAVTLRYTVKVPGVDEPQTATSTTHVVAVDGQWRWILTPKDYKAYKANRCARAS